MYKIYYMTEEMKKPADALNLKTAYGNAELIAEIMRTAKTYEIRNSVDQLLVKADDEYHATVNRGMRIPAAILKNL